MSKKKEWISLILGFLGALLGLYGVVCFNQLILMTLPLVLRMISMIVVYWLIVLIPIILMRINKDTPADYGFSKNNVGCQILIGIFIAVVISLVLTLVPHLLGVGEYFDTGKNYQYLWQFIYEFFYCIVAVGFAEEFVFRGFIYERFKRLFEKDWIAVIGSSVLFGVFHIFNGNIGQMILTGCLGAFFCFCRLKIKNCSLLSLIIVHGIYDALITVWASLLL